MSAVDDDFVEAYMEYANMCTQTAEAYHRFCGYAILSHTVLDGVTLNLRFGSYRPNLWVILVGPSTLSKKTTSMNIARNIIKKADVGVHMPDDFSPEGLVDFMQDTPRGFMWIDEIGGLLSVFSKEYMGGAKEVLMKMYSGEDITRKLKNEIIHVSNPSVGIVGTTTISTMRKHMDVQDMFSGFGARFLHIHHNEKYEWEPVQELTDDIIEREKNLIDAVKMLAQKFRIDKNCELTDEAYDLFNDWDRQMIENLRNNKYRDELGSMYGRLRDYVFKFSMLNAVSSRWTEIEPQDEIIEIREEDMLRSIEMVEEYKKNAKEQLLKNMHGEDRMRVYERIKDREPIGRSELMRTLHMKASKLNGEINTLEQMGLVKESKDTSGDGRPVTQYETTSIDITA